MGGRRIALMLVVVLALSGLLATSCAGSDDSVHAPQLPDSVESAAPSVRAAYQFAVQHPEALAHQPCYCGCGGMGHTSNLSCFVKDRAADGTITFDTHALGCGICVDIARETERLTEEGKTPAEIRTHVDARFGQFGPPTPTPFPGA